MKSIAVRGWVDGFYVALKGELDGLYAIPGMAVAAPGVAAAAWKFIQSDNDAKLLRASIIAVAVETYIRDIASLSREEVDRLVATMAGNLFAQLYSEAERNLPWEPFYEAWSPDVLLYMYSFASGYVSESLVVTATGVGAIPKVRTVAKALLQGAKVSHVALSTLSESRRAVTRFRHFVQRLAASDPYLPGKARAGCIYLTDPLTEVMRKRVFDNEKTALEVLATKFDGKRELFDEVAKIMKTYISRSELNKYDPGFENIAKVLNLFPDSLDITDDEIKIFVRFYGSISHKRGSQHTTDLVKLFGGESNFDKDQFRKLLAQLGNGLNGFKLERVPDSVTDWMSPAGVLYGKDGLEGHRVSHVLAHTVPNWKNKPVHGVWAFEKDQVLKKIDEFYQQRGSAVANNLANDFRENNVYKIYAPGVGNVSGQDYVLLILEKADGPNKPDCKIITAYPVDSSYSVAEL